MNCGRRQCNRALRSTLYCRCGTVFCSDSCFVSAWHAEHSKTCVHAADIQREVAEKRRTSDKSTTALLVGVALSRTQPGGDASPATKGKSGAAPLQHVPNVAPPSTAVREQQTETTRRWEAPQVSPPSTAVRQEQTETTRRWEAPQVAPPSTAVRKEPTETTHKWQAADISAKVNPPAVAATPPRRAASPPQVPTGARTAPTSAATAGFMRRYTLDEFSQMGEPIGSGSYGQVTKVMHKQTAEIFAMKVISKKKVLEHQMTSYLTREVKTQIKVQHPNILRLIFYMEDEINVYLLLEYAKNGSLFSVLRKRGRLPEPEAAAFFVDVASALDYLHKHGVVHRDLKPENILMCDGNVAKLADFGWCAEVSKDGGLRHTFCGTWDYLSPEMVSNEPHDHTVDIWAMGVLLYEMLVGRPPFSASSQFKAMSRITKVDLQIPENISAAARNIISNLIVKDRTKRLTLVAAAQHHWVVKYVRNSDAKMKWTGSDLQEGSKLSASAEAAAAKISGGADSTPINLAVTTASKQAPSAPNKEALAKHPGLSAATVAAASKAGLLEEVKKRLPDALQGLVGDNNIPHAGGGLGATALAETRPVSPAVAIAANSKDAIAAALAAAAIFPTAQTPMPPVPGANGLFKGNSVAVSAPSATSAVNKAAVQPRSRAADDTDILSKTQPVTRTMLSRSNTQTSVGAHEQQKKHEDAEDVLSKTTSGAHAVGHLRFQTTQDFDENETKKEPWQNSKTFADIRKWVRKNSAITTPLGEELDKTLPLGQAASTRGQSDVFSIPVTNTDTLVPLPKRRAASKRRQRTMDTSDMSYTAPAQTSNANHPSGVGEGCPTPLRERPIMTAPSVKEQPASSSLSPLRTAGGTAQTAHGYTLASETQQGAPRQGAVVGEAAVGDRVNNVVTPIAADPAVTDADRAYDINHMKEDFRGQLERLMNKIDGN